MTALSGKAQLADAGVRLASKVGLPTLLSRLQPGYGCLITFHRVAPTEQWAELPNRDFHIDAGFLAELLEYLRRTGWAVVTLDEAVARVRGGRQERFVNFSIDDAYRDTLEVALPVFRKCNVPVTVFVSTGIPDRTMSLWQAGLEFDPDGTGRSDPGGRNHGRGPDTCGKASDVREAMCRLGRRQPSLEL